MSTREFSLSVLIIVATMALVALIELAAPFFPRTAAQRGRHRPNLGLTALTVLFNWALTSASALVALALSLQGTGLVERLGLPIAVQVAASVIVLDFFYGYVAHRAMHVAPLLWRVHRVHHSDPFVDVTTAYRTHPLEVLWRFLFMIVPIWVLGIPAPAVLVYRLLSAINAVFEHANIRLWRPLDRALSSVWVTPDMHKLHHSRDAVETDSNFGNILSIYDRILRTFTPTHRARNVVYGLDDAPHVRDMTLARLLTMPFRSGESSLLPKEATEVPA